MSQFLDPQFLAGHAHYLLFIVLMMTGLYIVVDKTNLVKKIVGLNIFQVSVFMFYVSIGKLSGGTAPIFPTDLEGHTVLDPSITYSNPLPHVLILTAIVVGIATTSLGLALIVRIREEYGTIDEEEILHIEQDMTREENKLHGDSMGGLA